MRRSAVQIRLVAVVGVVALLSTLGPRAASANIVLEAHDGQRPKDAARLAPFLAEMARLGFDASPADIFSRFGGRLPRPGSDPTKKLADVARKHDYALGAWKQQPPLDQLLPPLQDAVAVTFDNPAFLISDPSRREPFRRVLIALALAYKRAGDLVRSEATEMELIRMYPDQAVTQKHDGPDAEQLYQKVRANVVNLGRGTLTVNVNDPSLVVYVDETVRRPNLPIADLAPGPYRVVVVDPDNNSRRYDVEAFSNQDAVLDVDWEADSAFVYTPASAAFIFQTHNARTREGELARRLVRSTGDQAVVLIGISKSGSTLTAVASFYSTVSGRTLRRAQVMLGVKGEPARLVAMAQFIAKGIESQDVTVLEKWRPKL
jgi:hypothetical protein